MTIRNVRRSVLVAAGVGALAVSGLFAGRLLARGFDHGGPGEDRAPRMFRKMARHLELTEAQQSQIRGILRNHASAIEAQVQAGMEARRALHEAVMAEPSDENVIRSLAARAGEVHADGALLFAKVRAEVWPLLTAAQQEKVRTFHARRGHRGEKHLRSLDRWLRSEG